MKALELLKNEVHVWHVSLDVETPAAASFWDILAPHEKERAGAFFFEMDRRRFVVGHGILRRILSLYLGIGPALICLCAGPLGKPAVLSANGTHQLYFNMSHSDDAALYAVSLDREVGVDIEHINADLPVLEIARRFFTADEIRNLRGLTSPDLERVFYRYWTCKEAYLKATGEGLDGLLHKRKDGWSLIPLDIGPEYAAAIAAQGSGWSVRYLQLDEYLFSVKRPGDQPPEQDEGDHPEPSAYVDA